MQRWQFPINQGTLETQTWSKLVEELIYNQSASKKCASHSQSNCKWYLTVKKMTKTLISYSHLFGQCLEDFCFNWALSSLHLDNSHYQKLTIMFQVKALYFIFGLYLYAVDRVLISIFRKCPLGNLEQINFVLKLEFVFFLGFLTKFFNSVLHGLSIFLKQSWNL